MKKLTKLQESGLRKIVKTLSEADDRTASYIQGELSKITFDSEYPIKLKIYSEGGDTKTLSLSDDSIPILIKWLKQVQSKSKYIQNARSEGQ